MSQNLCDDFAKILHDEFEMSMIGELNFFLGLQIKQIEDRIFFNQSKYIKEMLKKLGLQDFKSTKTPMSTEIKLTKYDEADSVDSSKYRENPNTIHLEAVKRIFRPSERRVEDGGSHGGNLPLLLVAHLGRSENGKPLQSTLTSGMTYSQPPGYSFHTQGGNASIGDELKMPYHVGSYDGKGDPNNYLHLFEGKVPVTLQPARQVHKDAFGGHNIKQRDGEGTRAFVPRYTYDTLQILGLHKEQRIYGFVYRPKIKSLVDFLSTDLPTTYKGLMETTYIWIKAKEMATNRSPNDHI
nr:retrovirus-related Pol polyprotein from transposon TNT 1-94 [Tanacetum cinerariifolium]